MDSLDGTAWDIVIAGTGIQQSLLALSLSRTNLKILHLDRNDYYGGEEAALSLQEAEAWVNRVNNDTNPYQYFSDASIEQLYEQHGSSEDGTTPKLSYPRAYSLALAPQLLYSRSHLLPKLVSSRVYRQLEFLAVGSWFTYGRMLHASDPNAQGALKRIPSSREDVFADSSLDLNGRRRLMKFLRFIGDQEQQSDRDWEDPSSPLHLFPRFLEIKFGIPQTLQDPINALTLSSEPPSQTRTEDALRGIARHLQSIGVFGRGFGSVISKWGGLSEIAQVGCRAAAVGGATYVLDKPIVSWHPNSEEGVKVVLQGGESVTTKWLAGCDGDLATGNAHERGTTTQYQEWYHSISIIDSPLISLFPPTADGSPAPAGAVVYHTAADENIDAPDPFSASSVYMQVHSSDTGECPSGQSVIYASVPAPTAEAAEIRLAHAQSRLEKAVRDLLTTAIGTEAAHVLWCLKYAQRHQLPSALPNTEDINNHILRFPSASIGVAFEDAVIERVKQAWKNVLGEDSDEGAFMVFEDREGFSDDGDDQVV